MTKQTSLGISEEVMSAVWINANGASGLQHVELMYAMQSAVDIGLPYDKVVTIIKGTNADNFEEKVRAVKRISLLRTH